jgi:hypothetical protein
MRGLRKSTKTVLELVGDAPKGPLPEIIPPQIATLVDRAPTGDRWVHEIKFRWGWRPDGTNPCRHVERYPERLARSAC